MIDSSLISFKKSFTPKLLTPESTILNSFDCLTGIKMIELESLVLKLFQDGEFNLNICPVKRVVVSDGKSSEWYLRVYSRLTLPQLEEYSAELDQKLKALYISDKKIKYYCWIDPNIGAFLTFNTIYCAHLPNLLKGISKQP